MTGAETLTPTLALAGCSGSWGHGGILLKSHKAGLTSQVPGWDVSTAKGTVIRACTGQWDSLIGELEDMMAEGLSISSHFKVLHFQDSEIFRGEGAVARQWLVPSTQG